jgi:hypothetical protein
VSLGEAAKLALGPWRAANQMSFNRAAPIDSLHMSYLFDAGGQQARGNRHESFQ